MAGRYRDASVCVEALLSLATSGVDHVLSIAAHHLVALQRV
jgi:hypothetical protein